jgi:antirestriction protein ArdC
MRAMSTIQVYHDMPSQIEIRHQITNQIIEDLRKGNLAPWRKPWQCDRQPSVTLSLAFHVMGLIFPTSPNR